MSASFFAPTVSVEPITVPIDSEQLTRQTPKHIICRFEGCSASMRA